MAQPIPVLRRAPRKRDDAPSAPVIAGSLVEDNLLNSLPELSLPAGTPEAFSLVSGAVSSLFVARVGWGR